MAVPHPLVAALVAERVRRGITVSAVARRTGYTREAIANWEAGRRVPDLDRLEDYATALGMSVTVAPVRRPVAPLDELIGLVAEAVGVSQADVQIAFEKKGRAPE